jgi:hypothetical protein
VTQFHAITAATALATMSSVCSRLKQFRRIATRYDKTAASFLGSCALPPSVYGYRIMSTDLSRCLSDENVHTSSRLTGQIKGLPVFRAGGSRRSSRSWRCCGWVWPLRMGADGGRAARGDERIAIYLMPPRHGGLVDRPAGEGTVGLAKEAGTSLVEVIADEASVPPPL